MRTRLTRANMMLYAAAVLFTAAAAIAVYRLDTERNDLFHAYGAGTWGVAEIQVEHLKMIRLAGDFRNDPSLDNLDKLQEQFSMFRRQVRLAKRSSEQDNIRDLPSITQAFDDVTQTLSPLEMDFRKIRVGDPASVGDFVRRADASSPTIASLMQQVFGQEPPEDQPTEALSGLDLTNVVLGIAFATGLLLILLGLKQLRRAEVLHGEHLKTRAQLETRIGAIEATRDGIALVAPDGSVEFANQSLVALLGILSADIILGRFWSEVPAIGKVPLPTSQDGKSVSTEIAIARGTKDTRYWDLSITPREDGGSVVLVRDNTERRLAQRQNELLREQFLRSQKMEAVGRLTGGIAHDFNNILAAVTGFAHLLRDDLVALPEQAGFAGQILAASERGKELVRRMLSFSRAEMERQTVIDLNQIAAETIHMLSSALPQRGRFYSAIPEKLPPIFGNATQIAQVIMNLVLNASDATEETKGVITLEFRVTTIDGGCAQGLLADLAQHASENPIRVLQVDDDTSKAWIGILTPPGDYAHIRVADTGTGIPFNVMERMFDPFFTTKGQGKGTGLGLASVIGIVKSHHGAIAVESRLGSGSEFHILLPVADASARVAVSPKSDNPALVLSGIRVLVVDDDIAVGTVLQKMFDRFDCDATLCPDPVVARESILEDPTAFDLIVTDMTMPDLNGIDLAAACRRAGFTGTLILVTGRADTVSEPLMRSAGINGLLAKPFSQEDVAREVRAALGHGTTMAL